MCTFYLFNISESLLEDFQQISDLDVIVNKSVTFITQRQFMCNTALLFLGMIFQSTRDQTILLYSLIW